MPSTTRNNNNNNNNNNEPVTFNDHHTNKIKRVNKKDDESKLTLQWLITVGFLGWAIAMTVFYVQETKANGSARTGININADKESNDNNNNNNNNNDIADPLIVRAALKGMYVCMNVCMFYILRVCVCVCVCVCISLSKIKSLSVCNVVLKEKEEEEENENTSVT
jgi:hypothetical protein